MFHQPSLRPALFAGRKAEGDVRNRTGVIWEDAGSRTGIILEDVGNQRVLFYVGRGS